MSLRDKSSRKHTEDHFVEPIKVVEETKEEVKIPEKPVLSNHDSLLKDLIDL